MVGWKRFTLQNIIELQFRIYSVFNEITQWGKPQKKVLLLMAGTLRGGGVKGQAITEKNNFFGTFFPTVKTAIDFARGDGG